MTLMSDQTAVNKLGEYPRKHIRQLGLTEMDDQLIADHEMMNVIIRQAKQYQK